MEIHQNLLPVLVLNPNLNCACESGTVVVHEMCDIEYDYDSIAAPEGRGRGEGEAQRQRLGY